MSAKLSHGLHSPEKQYKVDIDSAIYHGGPPVPTRDPQMLNFVDTKEMVRGPEDPPGYWVVTIHQDFASSRCFEQQVIDDLFLPTINNNVSDRSNYYYFFIRVQGLIIYVHILMVLQTTL